MAKLQTSKKILAFVFAFTRCEYVLTLTLFHIDKKLNFLSGNHVSVNIALREKSNNKISKFQFQNILRGLKLLTMNY